VIRRLALCAAILVALGAAAEAKTYSAERYDSYVEALRGGTLRITETVTLRFDDGTFTEFFRTIPARATDGIEIVSASMDGVVMPAGDGPGHVKISASSRVRVTWQFPPVSGGSRTFAVTYLVHGTVRQQRDGDLIGWRVLPSEHGYRIQASAAEIVLPVAPAAPPTIDARRVGESTIAIDGSRVRVEARNVRANGWFEIWVRLPGGSLIDAPPRWQQRQDAAREMAGAWALTAGVLFLAGLAILVGIRQRYDAPPGDLTPTAAWSMPPDPLSPSLAGALLSNGSANLEHAMAEIFALADRGELRIDERRASLGRRDFTITRTPSGRPLSALEGRALEIIFSGRYGREESVSLGTARSRLMRRLRQFRDVLKHEMHAEGLLDNDRQAVRGRFLRTAIGALIAAGALAIAFAPFANRFGGWPMLIPLALGLFGIVALIAYAAHTPLSNEGVRRSNSWRGFQRYLRRMARDAEAAPGRDAVSRLLPFAVALSIAPASSSYLKRQRLSAPAWFRAAGDAGDRHGAAFAAFVASGGSGASGSHHGAAGGAAAGGGASGAS
jgi:hypothetical protein